MATMKSSIEMENLIPKKNFKVLRVRFIYYTRFNEAQIFSRLISDTTFRYQLSHMTVFKL